jgi:hypothetical protein
MFIFIQAFGRGFSIGFRHHDPLYDRIEYFSLAFFHKGELTRCYRLSDWHDGGLEFCVTGPSKRQGWRLRGPILAPKATANPRPKRNFSDY